ncbi:hypothetical protein RHSIM_Rhsim03G0050800 [Rhododendron simsii]|uniref:Uncharacterized protein n=1 Tax=Rhododendron simsii TaxID=118357 RepID=A0A834H9G9_RHOSS|nr:hypothetical protein RHSIM_Rhsim03G0050800 [Rhododendron simsii]
MKLLSPTTLRNGVHHAYLEFTIRCKSHLMGNGILKTWLNLGEDVSIFTCGTYHGDTIVHNENIEASKEGETRKLKGIWIHPRFLQVPPNQSW